LLALAMSGKPGVLALTNRRAPFVVSRCSGGEIAALGCGCEQGGGRPPCSRAATLEGDDRELLR
jgi:hypothetical protein